MAVRSASISKDETTAVTPTRRSLVLLGIGLLPFTLVRVLMLILFWQDFRQLGLARLSFGLLHGRSQADQSA